MRNIYIIEWDEDDIKTPAEKKHCLERMARAGRFVSQPLDDKFFSQWHWIPYPSQKYPLKRIRREGFKVISCKAREGQGDINQKDIDKIMDKYDDNLGGRENE